MTIKRQSKTNVVVGIEVDTNGTQNHIFIPASRLKEHIQVPVWNGQAATLYFEHYDPRRTPMNWHATTLFNRQGFYVHGPAIVGVHGGMWHCFRVVGDNQSVRAQISHLTLGDHAVVPTSGYDTLQDVIVRDNADMLLVKMALS